MNTQPNISTEDQKMPKQRHLLAGKKYRETVKKWGEPTKLLRKRVIIVPSIACEARDVDIGTLHSQSGRNNAVIGKASYNQSDSSNTNSKVEEYKAWLAERKKLRAILSKNCLEQSWLEKKSGKTPLESRVLSRMKRSNTPDIRVRKVLPEIVAKEEDEPSTGVDKGVPTISQPSPVALAIIQEYLDRKRMRLVDLFAQADKDKNWIVSRDEFRKIIRSSGIPLSKTDLEDLIMTLDKDDNDALDYLELSSGRQAYLEERMERQSSLVLGSHRKPNVKIPEPLIEVSKEDIFIASGEGQDSRPTSPQRISPPRTFSPTLKDVPDTCSSTSFFRRGSSSSLLEIPATSLSEKVEKVSLDEMKEMRMKKQKKRKEKEKAKQKKKPNEKPAVAPSTLGGATGAAIDRYRKHTLQEYHSTVQFCDMHGVQLSKEMLGKVLLQPEDKPIVDCLPRARKPGRFTISSRHHMPSAESGIQVQIEGEDWIF